MSNNNRWNNIKKKYNLNNNITSSTVQKFLDLNFTDCVKDELCGVTEKKILDPALIMELRHEAVKQARKPWKEESTFKQKEIFMENIKSHNNLVDCRMIDNELSKFKMEVRKMNSYSNRKPLLRSIEIESDHDEISTKSEISLKSTTEIDEKNEIDKFVRESLGSSSPSMSEDSLESVELIKVSTMPKNHDCDHDSIETNDEGYQNDDNPMCFECCNDHYEFTDKNQDSRSFYSLPNLTTDDVDDLMIISKFQSVMSIDKLYQENCPCCEIKNEEIQNDSEKIAEIKNLDEKIEDAETEKMLIVKRMELEEKNYQQLVIMSNADIKSNDDESLFECERIVCDLFQVNQDAYENKKILRFYFKEWLQRVTVCKILKTNSFSNEDRIKKINGFLNKIRLEQNKGGSKIAHETPKKIIAPHAKLNSSHQKDYEHKLKMQQDIIELQKLKIKRQEQLITEIKLAKFSEMVKQSKKDLKLELINAKKVNAKLRAKARSIQLVANIPADPLEEERRLLLAQGLVVPKFLAKMQQRAQERLTRHEEASQRRLRIQQEKEDAKLAAEIAKRQEDEEAKKKRLLELREKRRQEKLAKQLKEQEREKYLMNLKKARDHYDHHLMRRLGFRAFELLIRLKRFNYKKSSAHRKFAIMRRCFICWFKVTKVVWDNKRDQADKHYETALMRRCVKIWTHIHSINQKKFLVAIDWYEIKITEKLFNKWIIFTEQCKMIESQKMSTSIAHYNCQIKWKLLECWMRFPALMKIEREAEVRRQKWRLKVLDLVPDYRPQTETL